MNTINTKKAKRRTIDLPTVQACIDELNRIEAAGRSGKLEVTGNWTAGQIMAHLAAWIEYGWDGYPVKPLPFFMRWFQRIMLNRVIKRGLSPGIAIPGVAHGTTGQDEVELSVGIDRYKKALSRMQNEPATYASPAFGKMDEQDWQKVNLRHAELHLGFLHYPAC